MAVWVIITTSLINYHNSNGRDFETRKKEYLLGITKIIERFKDCKIVIVENNSFKQRSFKFGLKTTFLDNFGVPVLYTKTNIIETKNYGMKELLDIRHCISHFGIQDDDFIVKVTGRYILNDDCPFLEEVKKLEQTKFDAIIRYGAYYNLPEKKDNNCISGLIGLRCKYVKEIEIPDEDTFVEWKWAKRIQELDDSKVCVLNLLGLFIRPGGHEYHFLV
jgi:hypothetical protein